MAWSTAMRVNGTMLLAFISGSVVCSSCMRDVYSGIF
jgi:hypothetical protein